MTCRAQVPALGPKAWYSCTMQPRRTHTVQLVVRALLVNPDREVYGGEVCAITGLSSGTCGRILARLETAGWVTSRWADSPRAGARPRHYYRLTGLGVAEGRKYAQTGR